MCMFSGEVIKVSDTKILATDLGRGMRGLVYEMKTEIEAPTAMILPVPVTTGQSVSFVDMSGYRDFFKDLDKLFPDVRRMRMSKGLVSRSFSLDSLEVVEVGDYVASFVPTSDDFERLDPQFRISEDILSSLPYKSFSFVVAQLDPEKASGKKIHPLAFKYLTSNDDYLFIPSLHVHHNSVERYSDFDHDVYVGWRSGIGNFQKSEIRPFSSKVDLERCHGLINDEMELSKSKFKGYLKNGDILVNGSTASLNFFSKQDADKVFYGEALCEA